MIRKNIKFEKLETREMFAFDLDVLPEPIANPNTQYTVEPAPIAESVPVLSSNPSASAKLFLDFDGNFESSWGSWSNVTTPAFDVDGNPASFNQTELNIIDEIFRRVAEDYSIFNVDVTTVDPGNRTNKLTASVAIGGSSYDWYGNGAGGVAYVGGFYNSAPNVGFAFTSNLQNNPKYIAEAASHEAGHLFGLQHQSRYDSNGVRTESYNSGGNGWAPIMGVGYYQNRTTWHNGTTSSATTFQDDIAILSNSNNGFGLKSDDYSLVFELTSSNVNLNGIMSPNETDIFAFSHGGGLVNFNLNTEAGITNLSAYLELQDQEGQVLVTNVQSLNLELPNGLYTVTVKTDGTYGNAGQYNLTGSFNKVENLQPEISVLNGTSNVTINSTVNFGSVAQNANSVQSFTVVNTGSENLNVDSVSVNGNFTISNFTPTVLLPNEQVSFTVSMDTTVLGAKTGLLTILSNDLDEQNFVVNLSGNVYNPTPANYISDSFTTKGSWVYSTLGYEGDSAYTNARSTNAKWTLNVANGRYDVYATWVKPAGLNVTTKASYTVNGTKFNNINQSTQRVDLTENNVKWTKIGTVTVSGGKVDITITNGTRNTYMIADAIMLKETFATAKNSRRK